MTSNHKPKSRLQIMKEEDAQKALTFKVLGDFKNLIDSNERVSQG